jgi:dihydrofolate reductase
MRKLRYVVAASLDGYIAGPKGEYDWIIIDPEIDFDALFGQFDTAVLGSKSLQSLEEMGDAFPSHMKWYVFSRTLQQRDHPRVTIVAEKPEAMVASLKAQPGKDIMLFGGGLLFRTLAEAGLVDTVEVAVIPILLGGGIPLLPSPAKTIKLMLTGHRVYGKTGIVSLEYSVGARD